MINYLVAKLETADDDLVIFEADNYLVVEFDEKLCKHYLEMSNAVADVASRIDKNISGLRLRLDYCVPQLKAGDPEIYSGLEKLLEQNNGYAIIEEQFLDALPLEDNENFEYTSARIDCFTNLHFVSESEYGGCILRTQDIAITHLLIMLREAETRQVSA
jgi:hypothetical protein